MIKNGKKIASEKAMTATQRAVDFWSTLDGDKLAKIGQKEKDMDIVGAGKGEKKVKFA